MSKMDRKRAIPACPIRMVALRRWKDQLEDTGPPSTFVRLCTSQHVADLQWITFFLVIIVFYLVLIIISVPALRSNIGVGLAGIASVAGAVLRVCPET